VPQFNSTEAEKIKQQVLDVLKKTGQKTEPTFTSEKRKKRMFPTILGCVLRKNNVNSHGFLFAAVALEQS